MKSIKKDEKFEKRLEESLIESTELTFVEPEVLLTQNQSLSNPEEVEEEVKELIQTESLLYKKYQNLLDMAPEEYVPILENLIEKSGEILNSLSKMKRKDDSVTS